MIGPTGAVRVMGATKPVDFRKGAEGLAALVREQMHTDPFSGVVYVFRAKRADRIKLIFWDGTGLVLYAKRLEDGEFRWPKVQDGVMRLTAAQLGALLRAWTGGVSTRSGGPGRRWRSPDQNPCDEVTQGARGGASSHVRCAVIRVMTSLADTLPDDPATLKAMVLAERARADRLAQILKEMQRHRFGRRAETLPLDQLELGLEDVQQMEAAEAAQVEKADPDRRAATTARRRANRGGLPEHLGA